MHTECTIMHLYLKLGRNYSLKIKPSRTHLEGFFCSHSKVEELLHVR